MMHPSREHTFIVGQFIRPLFFYCTGVEALTEKDKAPTNGLTFFYAIAQTPYTLNLFVLIKNNTIWIDDYYCYFCFFHV